jgi:hypothetical protein
VKVQLVSNVDLCNLIGLVGIQDSKLTRSDEIAYKERFRTCRLLDHLAVA